MRLGIREWEQCFPTLISSGEATRIERASVVEERRPEGRASRVCTCTDRRCQYLRRPSGSRLALLAREMHR